MYPVLFTALGVGGATALGALLGFLFKRTSHKFNDIVLSFAAGVMLSAAVIGLIIPSLEYSDGWLSILVTVAGIFCGAFCLNLIDKLVPHLHRLGGAGGEEDHPERTAQLNKVLLFVIAIGIHNLPEGIAAGVGFGSGDVGQAITVAGGIALQNIPEGMVIIAPMIAAGVSFGTGDVGQAITVAGGIALQNIPEGMVIIAPMIAAGMSRKKTLFIALMTGAVEVVGTFIGYFAVNISTAILPFALAFAGGTMLYVVSDEMIPETHSHGHERGATYALLFGFAFMLVFDFLLG